MSSQVGKNYLKQYLSLSLNLINILSQSYNKNFYCSSHYFCLQIWRQMYKKEKSLFKNKLDDQHNLILY